MKDAFFMINELKRQNETSRHPFIISDEKFLKLNMQNSTFMQMFGLDYFHQDLWGARKVLENNPKIHWDVGSSVFGFISHLLVFRQHINLIDIRPIESEIDGVNYICANATNMEGIPDNSIESLSALCSVEHFGLGRYGDEIDPDGWQKALKSFQRVLKSGGHLYLSVPIGAKNKVEFNAHRIFSIGTILECLSGLELNELSIMVNFVLEKVIWRNAEGILEKDKTLLQSIEAGAFESSYGLFEFLNH